MMNIMRQFQSNTIRFYLIRFIFYHNASLAFLLFLIVLENSVNTNAAKFKWFTQNHHNYVFLLIWPSLSWKTFEHYGSWNFLPSRKMDCHETVVFCKTSNSSFLKMFKCIITIFWFLVLTFFFIRMIWQILLLKRSTIIHGDGIDNGIYVKPTDTSNRFYLIYLQMFVVLLYCLWSWICKILSTMKLKLTKVLIINAHGLNKKNCLI